MISIQRRGSDVAICFESPSLNKNTHFEFKFLCGQEWIARAMTQVIEKELQDHIQAVRKAEYERGLKDAKGKKTDRKTWWDTWI